MIAHNMASAISEPLPGDPVAQTGQVPSSHHIRPAGDRPDPSNVIDNESGGRPERRKAVEAMGTACESDGFFKVSEIPLDGNISRGPSSLSSASSSPPREPAAASNPSGGNAAPAIAGTVGTTRLSACLRRTDVVVPNTDLAIMACSISLMVPAALNIKDLTSSWEAPWKVLYGVLMILSLASTVTGFFTAAWCPAVSWGRRLSPTCARFGLVDTAALFIVFLACKLGLGWAAGVALAALVVLVLGLFWAWIERLATVRAEAAAAAAVLQDGAGLPHDVP